MPRIENSIIVERDFDTTFDLTNDIELWTKLFTEYKEAKVLEKNGNEVLFQLTTYPEGERPSRTWVSRRIIDKENKQAIAERLDPKFPFKYMNIRWSYEVLSPNQVKMTWMQEFEVDPGCPISEEKMTHFLNQNTKIQMSAVKEKVESWPGNVEG
ncbi:aromatase [Laceyella sacchari]|jgi:aromatase|uniref:SRPBCC family protein n=1 Tax=Laceyella sacchari TaxID=37482 RepID=UPI0010EC6A96|nr:SRPBCC family protein [Laceyella sacchari]TCW38978.1 aromatase [Laceyella sacchari]